MGVRLGQVKKWCQTKEKWCKIRWTCNVRPEDRIFVAELTNRMQLNTMNEVLYRIEDGHALQGFL